MGVHLPEEDAEAFKDIARRERKKIKQLHKEIVEKYIKEHGDGNPVYTLEHFNDVNFLATPAFHRPLSAWHSYLTKCGDKEYKEWVTQLENLLNLEHKVTSQR